MGRSFFGGLILTIGFFFTMYTALTTWNLFLTAALFLGTIALCVLFLILRVKSARSASDDEPGPDPDLAGSGG